VPWREGSDAPSTHRARRLAARLVMNAMMFVFCLPHQMPEGVASGVCLALVAALRGVKLGRAHCSHQTDTRRVKG
jgi:hypothetical protein